MIEGSVIQSLSVSFLLPSCEEVPPEALPAPALYLRQHLICPPASRLYLKELLTILQTVSSCSRYTTFFLFGSRFHRQNALRYLYTNLSLNADFSENTLPFVGQSINNFSNYDISQSDDWECPSLSPHVLLSSHISKSYVSLQYKTYDLDGLKSKFIV